MILSYFQNTVNEILCLHIPFCSGIQTSVSRFGLRFELSLHFYRIMRKQKHARNGLQRKMSFKKRTRKNL